MTHRVAVIGSGCVADTHARYWPNVHDVEFVGMLVNSSADSSKVTNTFKDWDALLAIAMPDIIDICLPTTRQTEFVERAILAKLRVLLQQPLANSLRAYDELLVRIRESNVIADCARPSIFDPAYSAAKLMIEEGAIGTPAAVRISRTSSSIVSDNLEQAEEKIRPSLTSIIGDLDWLIWTFGPIQRVYALNRDHRNDVGNAVDCSLVTLRFASGAVGHVSSTHAPSNAPKTTLEIAGDAGLIEHDSSRSASLTSTSYAPTSRTNESRLESPMNYSDDATYLQLAAFVEQLATGSVSPAGLIAGREALRVLLAAHESVKTGKAVTL